MPITVKIPKRQIELTKGNQEILDALEKCQSSILNVTENEKNSILKNAVHTGITGSIFGDKHDMLIVNEINVNLDLKAYELYQNFTFFLNDVAKNMGLTAEIDADLLNDKKAVRDSFAWIRIILLRITLKLLATEQMKHFQVWEMFVHSISNMNSLINMHTSGMMGIDISSIFKLIFLEELKPWHKKIEDWATVKKIRHNMEIYFQDMIHIEKDILNCLYLRLQIAMDKKISSEAFSTEWIYNALHDFEMKILDTKDNQVIFLKKAQKIYDILKSQNKKSKHLDAHVTNTEFVKKLYMALYNLIFAKNLIIKMDAITNYHECFPLLMTFINTSNLERFIGNCIEQSLNACALDGLERTIMPTVWSNNIEIKQSTYISHISIKKTNDIIILEDDFLSKLIMDLINDFMKLCVTHELGQCESIVNKNHFCSTRSTRSNSNTEIEQIKSNKTQIKDVEQQLLFTVKTENINNIKTGDGVNSKISLGSPGR